MDRRSCTAFAAASMLFGCSHLAGNSVRTGPEYPPQPAHTCEVVTFLEGEPPPETFVVVGQVEARGDESFAALVPELQRQACELGANTVFKIQNLVAEHSLTTGVDGNVFGSSSTVFAATATALVVPDELLSARR